MMGVHVIRPQCNGNTDIGTLHGSPIYYTFTLFENSNVTAFTDY